MKVAIEACTWANRRGYGRFTRGLVNAMVADFPQHEFVLVVDRQTEAEGTAGGTFPPGATLKVVATSAQPAVAAAADGARSPLDLLRMGRAVSEVNADVFLFPTNYSYFPLWGRTRTVMVFHDASAENHPELIFPRFAPRTLWRIKSAMALYQTDRLVTVSSDARLQIAKAFDYPESAIDLVSEGTDTLFRPMPDTVERAAAVAHARQRHGLPLDRPLILYVGGISPHKNLDGLLRAMKLSAGTDAASPWHLALVGDFTRDSFLSCHAELVSLVAELGLGERVTFTGFVDDDDLVLLYNSATMLVLPSFSEGFGLPVLEAMACGLPVAVSNRYSLPEIVGDAGLLFDPSSPAQMARAIDRLLGDAPLRLAQRERGLLRTADYSWHAGARTMMRILGEAATATTRGRPRGRRP